MAFARDYRAVAAAAFLVGIAIRFLARDHVTTDWEGFYQHWYAHAREHGLRGLADAFTQYTPFYSYLLIAAVNLDGILSPVTIIKSLSTPFELGCALVGARLVGLVDARPERAAFAFAALWLSPSVLHNGAFWAQNDAMWTFFLMLAVWAAAVDRGRLAVLAFGMAISIKIQAIFFGPFLLGYMLHRRMNPLWIGLVPLVYVALAVPVLLAGRPPLEVATVYLTQATYYPSLWKGAANLYNMVPEGLYQPMATIGVALAAAGGLALAWSMARARALGGETLILAAAVSVALMPFLLPKMHERYFFAFDALVVVLACLRPVYGPVAVAALVNSLMTYLPFNGLSDFGQAVAGVQTLAILLLLARLLKRRLDGHMAAAPIEEADREEFVRASAALWFAYLAYAAARPLLERVLPAEASLWPYPGSEPLGLSLFVLTFVAAVLALRALRGGRIARTAPA